MVVKSSLNKSLMGSVLENYYKEELMRQLTEDSWYKTFLSYQVEDTRPRWKRTLSKCRSHIYWATLGRYRSWLHRDCGEY